MVSQKNNHSNELLWNNPDYTDLRSTHVLILGIGRFDKKSGVAPVTSPPASARLIADWFFNADKADKEKVGFHNPVKPLASLALLLSENKDGSRSEYQGQKIPRATFSAFKNAVRNWIERAESNSQNNMILFIASHGISAGRRTGILCEDYGSDKFNKQAGMTETEQLASALGQVRVAGKLVIFDCCRSRSDNWDPDATLGEPLIGGMGRDELPRRPQVMRSTLLDDEAYGRKNGPTFFTEALLAALNGLAANPNENWQINSSRLSEITNKIMGLHKIEDQTPQIADFELSDGFPVTVGSSTNKVTTFITVKDDNSDWQLDDDWEISVVDEAGSSSINRPVYEGASHAKFDLLSGMRHALALYDGKGEKLAKLEVKLNPPVAFKEIPDPYAVAPQQSKSIGKFLKPNVTLRARKHYHEGLIKVTTNNLKRAHDSKRSNDTRFEYNEVISNHKIVPIPRIGKAIDLEPGSHNISVTSSTGASFDFDLDVDFGEEVEIELPLDPSPREFLRNAVLAGILPSDTKRIDKEHKDFGPTPRLVQIPIAQAINENLIQEIENTEISFTCEDRDGRFHSIFVDDKEHERYSKDFPITEYQNQPWFLAVGENWLEAGFLPVLGEIGNYLADSSGRDDPWGIRLLVDNATTDRSHVTAYSTNRQWANLLAFLGRRDFRNSADSLKAELGEKTISAAVFGKRLNPLAAAAGSLVAVACSPIESFNIQEQWLRNLSEWFPSLPDGAIILGRHLHKHGEIDEARECYRIALERGVPGFSLAVDWLAEGLETLDYENSHEAKRWSRMSDPHKTFTVLRLSPEKMGMA
ncbi:MAG: hypothetical protein GY742_14765 [Hyphomicrobiales bacterium]|nr:hypothetical protein [Hyphomicrobiales bacterium]